MLSSLAALAYRDRVIAGSSLEPVIRLDKPRIINDLETYLLEYPGSVTTRMIVENGLRSSFTFPLKSMDRVIGCLFFSSASMDVFGDSHLRFSEQIAPTLSATVEKARLHREVTRERDRVARQAQRLTALDRARSELFANVSRARDP